MQQNASKTGKNFIGVAIMIFLAKLLGFARDIALAYTYGASMLTTVYQTLFGLPSLLFTSVGTAMSSVMIPDLTYYVNQRSPEERQRYVYSLFAQITLLATLITLLGIIFAPSLAHVLLGPDFNEQIADIASLLTRIMMPTLLFVSLTYLAMGLLQVHGRFILSAAVSVPFNLLIIITMLLYRDNIVLLGYVTTLGWLLQFLIQLPVLIRDGYRPFRHIDFRNPHTVNLFKQLIPILLGNSLLQLSLIIDRSFVNRIDVYTGSMLSFGFNLFITITSVFIVAMSTVVFPRLSRYSLEKDYAGIRRMLTYAFKILLFILLPYLVLVIAYHQNIIALVYEHGTFASEATRPTAIAFLIYSFAVPGYVCQELFTRVLYSLKHFQIPMTVSIICLSLNLVLDWCLYERFALAGVAWSTVGVMLLYALLMGVFIYRLVGPFIQRDFLKFSLELLLPVTALISIIGLTPLVIEMSGLFTFLIPLLLGGSLYLLVAWRMGLWKILLISDDDDGEKKKDV